MANSYLIGNKFLPDIFLLKHLFCIFFVLTKRKEVEMICPSR